MQTKQIIKKLKKLFLFIALLTFIKVSNAQLVINELSQGASGAKEYVEFLVIGTPSCDSSTVDLRGWVFDDNNGWHASGAGRGIAAGHKRFSSNIQWASIRMGALIVIYNETDRNPLIPADDPTDANHDCVYILPSSSSLFDHNSTTPSSSLYVPYAGSTYSGIGNWAPLGMSNSDDAFHSVSPSALGRPYFAIAWGNNVDSNTVYFPGTMGVNVVSMFNLIDDNPFNAANYSKDAIISGSSLETPGSPNNLANLAWINLMKNSCLPFTSTNIIVDTTVCSGTAIFAGGALQTTSGTYYDTIIASVGCDTLKRTNLTVRFGSSGILNQDICSGSTYFFNGINQSITGTYLDTVINSTGCDSTITLNLTVVPNSTYTINQSICTGQSYLFNGISRNTTGTYLDTLINYTGCDSILTLNLTVNAFSSGAINRTICAGQSYLFNGINRTSTGTYIDTLPISLGCDSILTLYLTVVPTSTASLNISICNGQTYLFNGVNRSAAGTYLDTLANFGGCDSILTLTLSIRPSAASSINANICNGSSYLFDGINRSIAGSYVDTVPNSSGCDSIITLNLTINPTNAITQNINICEGTSYVVLGSVYTTTGTYFDTLTNLYGCDSILRTDLNVTPINYSRNISICNGQSLTIGGIARTTPGSYDDSAISISGCDSVMRTILSVNRTDSTLSSISLCSGDAFNGVVYTDDTTLSQTRSNAFGCDSVTITNIIVNPLPLVNAGNDTTINIGESALLSATGATAYYWNNGVLLPFNMVTPLGTTTYFVTGTDMNNCSNVDTITVFVGSMMDSTLIAIPNAFSPNGDGVNDVFKVLASQNLTIDLFQIFNRWGAIIFETIDSNVGWNGSYSNRDQPIGSYVYYVQCHSTVDSKIKSYTGTVTLLR